MANIVFNIGADSATFDKAMAQVRQQLEQNAAKAEEAGQREAAAAEVAAQREISARNEAYVQRFKEIALGEEIARAIENEEKRKQEAILETARKEKAAQAESYVGRFKEIAQAEEMSKAIEQQGRREAEAMEASNAAMMSSALATAGAVAGFSAVIATLRQAIDSSIEFGNEMTKAAQRTGLAVDTLSVMHYAAAVTGSDFDGLTNAIGRMDANISKAADGQKQAAALIKSIGLNAKDLVGNVNGANIAFDALMRTIAATTDPIRKQGLAMELVGRAGKEQIPVLVDLANHWDDYSAKTDAAGMKLDRFSGEQLAQAKAQFGDLQERVSGLGLQLTEGLLPSLNQIAESFQTGSVGEQGFSSAGDVLGSVLKGLVTAFDAVFLAIKEQEEAMIGGGMVAVDYGKALYKALHLDTKGAVEAFFDAQNDAKATFSTMLDEAKTFKHQMDALWGDSAPKIPAPHAPQGTPWKGYDESGGGKPKTDDPIAQAASALADAQAKLIEAAQKDADEEILAEIEAAHKRFLLSDEQFYDQKLQLQNQELDAQAASLRTRLDDLQKLYDRQHNDKGLKRDSSGVSEQEYKTAKDMLDVQEKLTDLAAKRVQMGEAAGADRQAQIDAVQLANLRAAAELEKQRGNGIEAQIGLMRKELDLEVQRLQMQGASPEAVADTRAIEQRNELNLQAEQIYRQIQQVLEQNRDTVKELNDEAAKNPLDKSQLNKTINQDNRDTAQSLRALTAQYDALAQQLQDPATIEAAHRLNAELQELSTPNQRGEAQWVKELDTSLTGMFNRIVEGTALGTESFHKMAKSMEKDLLQLALKATEQALIPGMGGPGGGGGGFGSLFNHPHAGAGQQASGMLAPLAALAGPSLWKPPTGSGGGFGTAAAPIITQLANRGGSNGAMPSITLQLTNQSQTPLSAQHQGDNWQSQLGEFVTHWILNDAAQGGPIKSAFVQGNS